MAFEELSALTGQDLRKVEFEVPKVDIECRSQLPDFRDFDRVKYTPTMLKPSYGLKGAPRAWHKKLHRVLIQWLSCMQSCTDLELYGVHKEDGVKDNDSLIRATEHIEEQRGTGNTRIAEPLVYKKGNLQFLLRVHVDDIKGVAPRDAADPLLKHPDNIVG